MARDGRTRLVRESRDGLAALPGEETKQVFGKRENVQSPLPQGGNGYLDDVQPVEQILAKCARGSLRFQVAVGCGQDADVPRAGSRVADALVTLFLQQPQQLWLQGRRQVADLVQEERPARGCCHLAEAIADGPGERARTWPKSSLSSNSADRLGQCTVKKGPPRAGCGHGSPWQKSPCRSRFRRKGAPSHRWRPP